MKFLPLLLLCCPFFAFAQIPENFEFLDHRQFAAQAGVMHQVEEGILYVNHNWDQIMTQVSVATPDNELINIWESTLGTRSKKIILPDGTVQILLFSISDYDVLLPGFYSIKYNNGQVSIDTVMTYELDLPNSLYAADIASLENNEWVLVDYDKIYQVNANSEILTSIENTENYRNGLVNDKNDIYLFSENLVSLWTVNGLIPVVETIDPIYNIVNHKSNFLVLQLGTLSLYNEDFSQLIKSWSIPTEVNNLNQIFLKSDDVPTIFMVENDQLNLLEFDGLSFNSIFKAPKQDNEFIYLADHYADNELLIRGKSKTEFVQNHFIRNIPLDEEVEYDRVEVAIDNIVLVQEDIVLLDFYIDSQTGDTTFIYQYYYNLDLDLINDGNEEIFTGHVYSENTPIDFGPLSPVVKITVDDLAPQQEISFVEDFSLYSVGLDSFRMAVPGANYKFNGSSRAVGLADFSTGVNSLVYSKTIKAFPNPAQNEIYFESNKKISKAEVFNAQGILLVKAISEFGVSKINLGDLATGNYFIRCYHAENDFPEWLKVQVVR